MNVTRGDTAANCELLRRICRVETFSRSSVTFPRVAARKEERELYNYVLCAREQSTKECRGKGRSGGEIIALFVSYKGKYVNVNISLKIWKRGGAPRRPVELLPPP